MTLAALMAQMDTLRRDLHALDRSVALMEHRLAAVEAHIDKPKSERHHDPGCTPSPKLTPLLGQSAQSFLQWTGGLLAIAWLAKGGDLQTVLMTLGNLLK